MLPVNYIYRSLVQRRSNTLASLGSSALVVVVFCAALMIPKGIDRLSNQSRRADIALLLSLGATTETESSLDDEAARAAVGTADVSVGADGQPDAAPEVVATILMEKLGAQEEGRMSDVLVRVRGLTPRSLGLRPEVRVTEGRLPTPGTAEAMVGRGLRGHFKGLDLGQSFELKRAQPINIVGVFESGGSLDESEVFTDAYVLRTAIGKDGLFSSIRVRISPDRFDAYKASIEEQKRFGMEVRHEAEFIAAQYGAQAQMMQALGFCVSLFFGIGGVMGALITMYSSVANRSREIGILRALGFSRKIVFACIIIESVVITFLGGAVGAALAIAAGRIEVSLINVVTLSEMVFRLRADPPLVASAMVVAVMLGLGGGIFPAVQAARIRPVEAMRK